MTERGLRTEKNLFPFTEKRAKEVLANMPLISSTLEDGVQLRASMVKCERVEGESVAMNRKGKCIFIFDLAFTFKYEAVLTALDTTEVKFKGEIILKDVASDSSDPVIKVTQDETAPSKDAFRVAQNIRLLCLEPLLHLIDPILDEMKAQIDGLQAPQVTEVSAPGHSSPSAGSSASSSSPASPASTTASNTKKTSSFSQTLECDVPSSELFACFTDANRVQAYTGAPAVVENKVGSKLSFYGGSVVGEIVSCEPSRSLGLKWRIQSWSNTSHWSTVTLTFESLEATRTKLILSQRDIPSSELDRTKSFWEEQFWTRMRALFGWRMRPL